MNLLITITISAFNGLMVYNVCEQELFNWDGTYESALEFLNSKEVNPLPIEDKSEQESFTSEISNILEKDGAIQIQGVNAEGFDILLVITEVKPETIFQSTI